MGNCIERFCYCCDQVKHEIPNVRVQEKMVLIGKKRKESKKSHNELPDEQEENIEQLKQENERLRISLRRIKGIIGEKNAEIEKHMKTVSKLRKVHGIFKPETIEIVDEINTPVSDNGSTSDSPKYSESYRPSQGEKEAEEEENEGIVEEQNSVVSSEVEHIRRKWMNRNKYEVVSAQTRNVILVARSNSIQTTAVNLIQNPCSEPMQEERDIDNNSALEKIEKEDVVSFTLHDHNVLGKVRSYQVNLLKISSEQTIEEVVKICTENRINNLHCVLIHASSSTDYKNDTALIDKYISLFRSVGKFVKIGYVIPTPPGKNDEWKKGVVKEISTNNHLSVNFRDDIFEFCDLDTGNNKMTQILEKAMLLEEKSKQVIINNSEEEECEGEENIEKSQEKEQESDDEEKEKQNDKVHIMFTGLPVDPQNFTKKELLNIAYAKVYLMRKLIVSFIFSSFSGVDLTETHERFDSASKIDGMLSKNISILKETTRVIDFNDTVLLRKLDRHEEDMNWLGNHKYLWDKSETTSGLISELKSVKMVFAHNRERYFMGENTFSKILKPWKDEDYDENQE